MKPPLVLAVAAALASLTVAGPVAAEEPQPAFEGLERASDPAETFRLNSFEVVRYEISGVFPTFVIGGKGWRPTRGKFRHVTAYEDFYRAVGRPDLAAQQATRAAVGETLFWTGTAAELAGMFLTVHGLYKSGFATEAKVGLGLLGGGLVAAIVGSKVERPTLSEDEAEAMAAAYNQRLRLHLGLGTATGAVPLGVTLRGPF